MSALYRRLAALAAIVTVFTVGMTVLLITFKVGNSYSELRHGRFELVAFEVDRMIERSLSLGMSFSELSTLAAALERRKEADDEIIAIDVADAAGRIAYSTDAARVGQEIPSVWSAATRQQTVAHGKREAPLAWRLLDEEASVAGSVMRNSFGLALGHVAVSYSSVENRDMLQRFRADIQPVTLAAAVATGSLLFLFMVVLARRFERETARAGECVDTAHGADRLRDGWNDLIGPTLACFAAAEGALANWRRSGETSDGTLASPHPAASGASPFVPSALPARKLAAAGLIGMLLIVAAAMAAISWSALARADRAFADATTRKAESVARSLAGTFDRAAELGIPLRKIPGIVEKLEEVRARHVELSRIALTLEGAGPYVARAAGGEPPQAALVRTAPIPSAADGGQPPTVEVAVDPRFIERLFIDLALDFGVILIVAVFIVLELIYFLTGPLIVLPLRSLSRSIAALAHAQIAGPIPVGHTGAMRRLAIALRQRRQALLDQFNASRARLRDILAARRQHGRRAADNAHARAAVLALRRIRDRFGMARRESRIPSLDPDSVLGGMRFPFFLLLLAEDLSRSFLPIYAGSMELGGIEIPDNLVVGLPIFLFMFIVAVSQPALGGWSERLGRRRAFLLGAAIAVASHVLAAQATTLAGLLVWRSGAGIAWAIAFVAAQGLVLDYTDKTTRARGLASFVTVILVSLACGPAVGGLLADGIGYRATFLVATALAGTALLVAWRTLPRDARRHSRAAPAHAVASIGELPLHPLKNWRFIGLLVFAAVPAKLILVAFCYYLIPLFLTSSGNSAATAGRIIMVYSISMVLLVPIAGDIFHRLQQRRGIAPHAWFVGIGIAFSGLAGIAMMIADEIVAAALLAGILGIAQAVSIAPQAAMVPELTRAEIARHGEAVVYGYYRLVERIGSALGPIVAAAMLQLLGFRDAFILLGMVVFACGVLFALLYARTSQLTPAVEFAQ